MTERAPALAQRFVLVALLAVVLPMSLVGVWTTTSAARSGRVLLDAQLARELDVAAADVNVRALKARAELLALGESDPVRRTLVSDTPTTTATGSIPLTPYVRGALDRLDDFDAVSIFDADGRLRLRYADESSTNGRASESTRLAPVVTIEQPLADLVAGDTMGTVRASMRLAALVPTVLQAATSEGPMWAVRTTDGRLIAQSGSAPELFDGAQVTWEGREWSIVERVLPDAGITLLLAGDLAPYQTPFTRSAQRGTIALLITAAIGVIIVLVATRQLTRDVERDFAQREALASVGEFASELAHEVRNPLGALRLDLQRAQELVDDPDEVATILPRVLALVDRLDRAVSGALRVTRGRTDQAEVVPLAEVVSRASASASAEFTRRGARLQVEPVPTSARVLGDAGALEQLTLNLLLNAAQALEAGGEATVEVSVSERTARLRITDTGRGMSSERLAEIEKPYRSSRRDGTGLGVKIARRIAQHHGGTLHFSSTPNAGTTAEVRLPLANG